MKLELQCECLAAFVRLLPDDVRAETLLTFDSPSQFQSAMDEHVPRREKLRAIALKKLEGLASDSEDEALSEQHSLKDEENSLNRRG